MDILNYDIDKWSTWGHVIGDIEFLVAKNLPEGATKLEALELFSDYLAEIILTNELF